MTKTTTARMFACYIWLADTIRSRGPISKKEIDSLWRNCSINDEHASSIPERTFFRYKDAVEELFGIVIRTEKSGGQAYYSVESDMGNRQDMQWSLMSQFALHNVLQDSEKLQDRILYEHIPGGTQYLTQIVEAMRDSRMLEMTRSNFIDDQPHTYEIAPYCMKVFKQRWYLFGKTNAYPEPRIYALDRILSLKTLNKKFRLPASFDAEAYFSSYYGAFCGPQFKPEKIRIRVTPEAAGFLRSLPIHASQKEVEPCVFSYRVAATFDFIQELRTHGTNLEVLEPAWLREQFKNEAAKLIELYKK